MRIMLFLKGKVLFIALNFAIAIFSAFLLYMVNANFFFSIFIPSTYIIGCTVTLFIEFLVKNNFYKNLFYTFENLENKCLLSEIIENPYFYEGKMLYDILKSTNKSMNDEIAKYNLSSAEYREYIELWVHEIKTPIAGATLICENTGNTEMLIPLQKIGKFVEQALFYSRSNNVEKDFLIKQIELDQLIYGVLRNNSKQFIELKVAIETNNLNSIIFSDAKWINFILVQILDNAIKYKSTKIKFYAQNNQNSVSLFIIDNGIGISKNDINRVFDKGFTGENGRLFAKSTGIGLYLCKKLCNKLNHNIFIKSIENKGTYIEIVFPKSNMYL